ncbi:MAG: DNA cytosine methyltransferase [Sulfurovaceae bacterium]|nr:DNA cytosine methyltransferase [Sulfurovaceae bacterium]MDD5548871.1 DNA cytosine methyltransferase [Sulfurovaceae bacterium]
MKKLKVATAFSGGFGSIEFALKYNNIPHEIVFACEYAEPQRKSYLLNHGMPTVEFCKDIKDLDGTKYKGMIDLYHLSPPCQSYSLAGNRCGALDDRGGAYV